MLLMVKKLISVSEENYEIIKSYGRAGESINSAVTKLIKEKKVATASLQA